MNKLLFTALLSFLAACGSSKKTTPVCDPADPTCTDSGLGADGGNGMQKPVVTQIASSYDHTCALFSDGKVKCWGDNGGGQLGNGSKGGAYLIPVDVKDVSNATAIATGFDFSCAIINNDSVKCWGSNSSGELGNGSSGGSYNIPVDVINVSGATAIAAGSFHACVVAGGNVKCWGDNTYGQLGGGVDGNSPTPVTVKNLTGGADVIGATAIAASSTGARHDHTCAVVANGAVKCWGYNMYGQLGNGKKVDTNAAVDVSGLSGAKQVSMDINFTCAAMNNGAVKCWGVGGALGGAATSSSTPVDVTNIANVVAIASGDNHSCAVINDGTMKCWGDNTNGHLGDETTTPSTNPVSVKNMSNATATSVASASCAIAGGSVKCWGGNDNGQLGTGDKNASYTPVSVKFE